MEMLPLHHSLSRGFGQQNGKIVYGMIMQCVIFGMQQWLGYIYFYTEMEGFFGKW